MKLYNAQLLPLVHHHNISTPIEWDTIFPQDAPVDVEIGFGQGEYLLSQTRENPKHNYLGIEIIWERVAKALNHITPKRLARPKFNNVRVMRCDAWIVLERLIAQRSVDNFCSLFPCPWPKKKHIKYRLFSNEFMKLINSRLKDKGTFTLVTDAKYFYDWVLEESVGSGFVMEEEVVDPQFETKFEKKWLNEGQNKFFQVKFIKDVHCEIPVKENIEVKSFKVDTFDPDSFNFNDYNEDVAIVCREFVFDPKLRKAVVHLIVSEEHLTQNIRVIIHKKDAYWRVCMAEGQDYFPTNGVNKAIELVCANAS